MKNLEAVSCPEVFCQICVLKNFSKFTRKHLCESLFKNTFFDRTPPVVTSENKIDVGDAKE